MGCGHRPQRSYFAHMSSAISRRAEAEKTRAAFLAEVTVDLPLMGIFDTLPGVFCFVKNRAGQTVHASSLWTARHGFKEAWEMIFRTDQDLTPGGLADGYLADDATVYRTGEPVLNKVEICLDEVGLPDWHVTSKYPLRSRKGEIIGIFGVARSCQGQAPQPSINAQIGPAIRLLRENLTEYPPAHRLAEACGLSVRQVQRRFTEALGLSPRDYWMKCRIRAACESIRSGQEKLGALSVRLGFCDQSSFTAQFRRHTGVTPSAFAKGRRSSR